MLIILAELPVASPAGDAVGLDCAKIAGSIANVVEPRRNFKK
jgi:hypothetical protein